MSRNLISKLISERHIKGILCPFRQAQGPGRGREPARDVIRGSGAGRVVLKGRWKGDACVALPKAGQRLGGRLPAEVAVEGDLMLGAAALGGAFAFHAQVHPGAQCDAPSQPHAVTLRPYQRQAAVGRQ